MSIDKQGKGYDEDAAEKNYKRPNENHTLCTACHQRPAVRYVGKKGRVYTDWCRQCWDDLI